MADGNQGVGLQLRSLVTAGGELELSLAKVPIPQPAEDEILVRIEGTPINPSDLGLLLGPADLSTAKVSGAGDEAVVTDVHVEGSPVLATTFPPPVANRASDSPPPWARPSGTRDRPEGRTPACQLDPWSVVRAVGEKRRSWEGPKPARTEVESTAATNPPLLATPGGVASCHREPFRTNSCQNVLSGSSR